MVKENLIPIENKKPFETVQELKNETPSFEEFMKTYNADEQVNYDDLTHSDISEAKGYGPTTYAKEYFTCGGVSYRLENNRFFIILEAEWGVDGQWFFGIPTYNSPKRYIKWHNSEAKNFLEGITIGTYDMHGIWQDNKMRWKIILKTPSEAERLLRYFASGGLSVRGRGDVHHRGAQNDIINTINTALETYRSGGEVFLSGREF